MRLAPAAFFFLSSAGCLAGTPPADKLAADAGQRAGADILCSCDCITCQRYDYEPRTCVEEAREEFVAPACLAEGADAIEACASACGNFGHACTNEVPLGAPGAPCTPTESG